ncbi:MAG: alpha/beta fold hydrolase [Clostridia bacterium]|nr:alpha/beta fold hydrolase [Clostridia bacterium]
MLCALLVMLAIVPAGIGRAQEGPYDVEEHTVLLDGQRIYGLLYLPRERREPLPAVIFSHGFGGSHDVGDPYARALAGMGYAVYCFDFRGGSPGSMSDGSVLDMSIMTEADDLTAVLDEIRSLPEVDEDKVFLMGTSQGGVVSAIVAAHRRQEVRGLILLYPAFVLVDTAQQFYKSADDIPETSFHLWMTVGRAYFEPLLHYDVYADVAAYTEDVLILHGDADGIVPLAYSEKAVSVYPSAQLKVIEGAGHGFYGEDEALALDAIAGYLDARLHTEPTNGKE